ncbi:MAG TPA: aquaporin [Gammaproteobacteria bacterium]|nr:aquaporin [Gammaproteobacteria bacterium]
MTIAETFRRHWPEYAIEGWALATFMMSAGVSAVLIWHPDLPFREAVGSEFLRRCLMGAAMGLTAIALIYSPWGRRSGAHMNPAVTLAFLRLGKIARVDAAFYIAAQFLGGAFGVLVALVLLRERFSGSPIGYIATQPGPDGTSLAFLLEALMSFGLMLAVLYMSSSPGRMAYTGLIAGTLVAAFIVLEAPISGMSMNPARSFASALPAGHWNDLWIYFVAPPLGMLAAATAYVYAGRSAHCAKLYHAADVRCIHCGYEPSTSPREHQHEEPGIQSRV